MHFLLCAARIYLGSNQTSAGEAEEGEEGESIHFLCWRKRRHFSAGNFVKLLPFNCVCVLLGLNAKRWAEHPKTGGVLVHDRRRGFSVYENKYAVGHQLMRDTLFSKQLIEPI